MVQFLLLMPSSLLHDVDACVYDVKWKQDDNSVTCAASCERSAAQANGELIQFALLIFFDGRLPFRAALLIHLTFAHGRRDRFPGTARSAWPYQCCILCKKLQKKQAGSKCGHMIPHTCAQLGNKDNESSETLANNDR